MACPKRDVVGRLPDTARRLLVEASAVGEPGSLERRIAVDQAIDAVQLRFPQHFREEALRYASSVE